MDGEKKQLKNKLLPFKQIHYFYFEIIILRLSNKSRDLY